MDYEKIDTQLRLPQWSRDYMSAERGQQTLFHLSLDDLVTSSQTTEAELLKWRRAGLLSFAPDPLGEYRQYHADEVRFISETIKMTGSIERTQEILADLKPPYAYDVNTTFFHLASREWRQITAMPSPIEVIEENLAGYIESLDELDLLDLLGTIEERMEELKK